ncbi:MAG TPA: ankyrin repeat domain-containing protein [Pyrinomonadaceae bacterium]|nr:ankyrin repeat domain-containing protein [Pyrinomonadaceae bacterium]
MRHLILLIAGLILSVVVPSDSVKTSAAPKQQKAQRTSRAARNRSQQVSELMNAAANGDTRKVLRLLDNGLNVNVSFPPDESEFSGMTVLMVASLHGYAELVEELIKRGANVNLKRYVGDTSLMFAARTGNVKTVNALLRAGANPNAIVMSPHAGELTPLNNAINSDSPNSVEIAKILIGAKAEINPKGDFFASPLTNAVDDLEMVKLLIASGANVNQKNFRGATALMIASGAGTALVVRYLLEKGADVNDRDQEGHNALDYAEGRQELFEPSRRDEIIQVLRKAQAESKPQ